MGLTIQQKHTILSNLVIKPRGGGFDPDAAAFFAAIEGAGGTLSPEVKTAWNSFVLREKDNSRYAKIKRLYPYLGGVINAAIIDAITLNSAINNNFIDGDCDPVCGLQGDGSTKYLDINTTWNDLIISNFDWQIWTCELNANTTDGIDGSNDSVNVPNTQINTRRLSNTQRSYVYNNTINVSVFEIFANGDIYGGASFSQTNLKVYSNTLSVTNSTSRTSDKSIINYYLFARNFNGSPSMYFDAKRGWDTIAEGMSEAEFLAYRTSYRTFLTEIGAI